MPWGRPITRDVTRYCPGVVPVPPVTGVSVPLPTPDGRVTLFTVTTPVVGSMDTVAGLAAEGVAPSCSNICTVVAWPVACTPPVLRLIWHGLTVIVSPTCGPLPNGKVLVVTTNVQDPNVVTAVKRAGCPSVPLTLGAVTVAVGVAAVVLVNVRVIG